MTGEWARSQVWPQHRESLHQQNPSCCGISEWQAKQIPTSGTGNSIHRHPQEWWGDQTGLGTSRGQVQWWATFDAVTKYFCQMPALQHRSEVHPEVWWETGLQAGICLTVLRQEPYSWAGDETRFLGRDVGPRWDWAGLWKPPEVLQALTVIQQGNLPKYTATKTTVHTHILQFLP